MPVQSHNLIKFVRMKRRFFIKGLSAGGMLALNPLPAWPQVKEQNRKVKKVHLLFKTHLDVGFTDLASRVLDIYFNRYIPSAMELARQSRVLGEEGRFVWTTGSWLIYEFLRRADAQQRKDMEAAIEAGDVVWHGLPFTTHTELLSASMLKAGMNISKVLDQRFGKHTVAGKMTDVPGHTRSLVPVMREQGLIFLHVGVNPASAVPEVPSMFRWQDPEGPEILVMYQGNYGGIMIFPGGRTAVSIVFTGDNRGPQNREEVLKVYDKLHKKFPEAKIEASDLNRVAKELDESRDQLPVVTREIGDTWIHGAGSDPWMIARFRELMRFRRKILNEGSFIELSQQDMAFSVPLSMVAEHTWGLDVKSHLKSWDVYNRDSLSRMRETELFRHMEKSWQEKRANLQTAMDSLPEGLKQEAGRRLDALQPVRENFSGMEKTGLSGVFDFTHFRLKMDESTGAIISLIEKKTGQNRADATHPLALFRYQTFDSSDYERLFNQYLRSRVQWALDDFGKPGLEKTNAVSRVWLPRVRNVYRSANDSGDVLRVILQVDDGHGKSPYGCPGRIEVKLEFPVSKPEIEITLSWFDKPATRLPEALWFSFVPVLTEGEYWMMDKSGRPVNPLNVVKNGGRTMHGVQSGVWLEGGNPFMIETEDAPLVAPGEMRLLNFDNRLPDPRGGMHFCLYDNVWGTNFTMWFDEDMKYRFRLKFT